MSAPIPATFSPLHRLSSLITASLASLESTCTDLDVPWPSLDVPTYASQPKTSSEQEAELRRVNNAEIAKATATIIAAAYQLINALREPAVTMLTSANSMSGCDVSVHGSCSLIRGDTVPLQLLPENCL
jgi:hypothetical protein